MSIRKRYWFSDEEIMGAAVQLALEEGGDPEEDWEQYTSEAPALLRQQAEAGKKVGKFKWQVDYRDQHGKRRHESFKTWKQAKAFEATTHVEIGQGTHVPKSESITVAQAGDLWLAECRAAGLEPLTIEQYETTLRLHIRPFIGSMKLVDISVATVRAFQRTLRDERRSAKTIQRAVSFLGSMIAEAIDHGKATKNPVRDMKHRRRQDRGEASSRHRKPLKVGVDIPTIDDVVAIINNAPNLYYKTLLRTAAFTGLRASELRGLRWEDLDLKRRTLTVTQRADGNRIIGSPKSASGHRSVPLPPSVATELATWRMQCPRKNGRLGLVFPNGQGNVEYIGNIRKRGYHGAIVAAGLTLPVLDPNGIPKRDEDGRPIVGPKYTKFHALRHFYASWCLAPRSERGLGQSPYQVKEWMGHSHISMTLGVYGHLFKQDDSRSVLDEADETLWAVS